MRISTIKIGDEEKASICEQPRSDPIVCNQ